MLQHNNNKNSMVLLQSRHEDQLIRTEDPDINPCSYSQRILDKGAQAHDVVKTASTNVARKTGYSHIKD
jgi:hypothetical protein